MWLAAVLLGANLTRNISPLIIPRPKEAKWSEGAWILPSRLTIVIGSPKLDRVAADAIAREIVALGGATPRISFHPVRGPFIGLGEAARTRWLRRTLRDDADKVPASPEGYWLEVTDEGAYISGRTSRATLYGAETLCQMIRQGQEDLEIPKAKIRDWPTLGWRGVHLFLGNKALHFHKKLIVNLLNQFKINHLVLECEEVKWKAIGDAAPDWAMSKSDLKKEIRFAEDHGITVVPLVNSAGHMKWLLDNKNFKDMAEDPIHSYSISPTSPRTYPFLKKLYAEVLNTFHTPVLHIGGDEVVLGSRYPFKSIEKYPLASDAYTAHINKLDSILKKKGVRAEMWADMFFSKEDSKGNSFAPTKEQAKQIRDAIPKNSIIFEWRYGAAGEPERLKILTDAGFHRIVSASWLNLDGVQADAKAIADAGLAGLLSTTWVGYNSQEKNVYSRETDFSAMIAVAEESWNGGSIPIKDLGYDPRQVLRKAYALPMPKQ